MSVVQEYLEELRRHVGSGYVTQVQYDVFLSRARGMRYTALQSMFRLSGPVPVKHCLLRTALCLHWHPSMSGGADAYLSLPDQEQFRIAVQQAADDLNCIPTEVGITLAHRLKEERIRRARKVLLSLLCPGLAASLQDPDPPCRSWLNDFCSRLDIRICRSQELELLRRIYCDRDAIIGWFLQLSSLFHRPVELMFNMDETYITAKKKLHCLTTGQQSNLTSFPVSPHMTGVVTVHAGGERIRPMIILPNKKTMRSLDFIGSDAFLASSGSGWMTKPLYRYYAMTFVSELSFLRSKWPPELRDETVLLFVDGHSSRWDFIANLIFWLFNVDVVTFPGHCTHLLQMFDVALAGPIKAEFKKLLFSEQFRPLLETLNPVDNSMHHRRNSGELRSKMIQSFLTALEKVLTKQNCRRSFEVTGIFPYDPSRVVDSNYAVDHPRPEHIQARRRMSKTNSKFLTSEECLAQMFRDEQGRDPTEEDFRLSFREILRSLRANSMDFGIALGRAPQLLQQVGESDTYKLCSFEDL